MNPVFYSIGTHICNHLQTVGFVYQLAETASVLWENSSAERFQKNGKARNLFLIASVALTFISALALFQGEWRWISKAIRIVPGLIIPMLSVPTLGAIVALVGVVGVIISVLVHKSEDLSHLLSQNILGSDLKGKISVKRDISPAVRMSQTANGSRILINLALAYFSTNPYLFLLTAALQVVNLGVVSRWSCIRYEHEMPLAPGQPNIKKLLLTFFCPVFPAPFCNRHVDEKELIKHITDRLIIFGITYKDSFKFEKQPYKVSIRIDALPKCYEQSCSSTLYFEKDMLQMRVWNEHTSPVEKLEPVSLMVAGLEA